MFDEIIAKHGYKPIDAQCALSERVTEGFLHARFSCQTQLPKIRAYDAKDVALVTGFGPTNSPTAGTLSVILRGLALQRLSGYRTDVIISDLGAWNSRNLDWQEIAKYTGLFLKFIRALGFDESTGRLRSHRDFDNLVCAGLTAKVMAPADFSENHEALDALYDSMNLRGGIFGIMQDALYTISDILQPLFQGKRAVIVMCGIEEHYFVELARIAARRLVERYGGTFIPETFHIAGLFSRLVEGFAPYPKMSKSIPDSSVSLGDSGEAIRRKIVHCSDENDRIILQLIEIVSDWGPAEVAEAQRAFAERRERAEPWRAMKERYAGDFARLAELWHGGISSFDHGQVVSNRH